ncbi:hypothetical protein P3T76_015149 [Phytophthora citrophthora]|uniref:Uncharacterized protein n=1 Tax=Phytophthora citrophthora TaxID=4793 RepID=A0AAD9G0S3_9STRA|nr:hypothetical protein P3T76_015149 [Phytophthora citrophthora]
MWQEVLKNVCYHGDFAMVRWALGHPMGCPVLKQLKRSCQLYQLLWNAVAGGNSVEVLQILKDSDSVDIYGPVLMEAVAKNDMNSIKWLVDNFPQSEHISDYCVLDEAARRGHLNLLD